MRKSKFALYMVPRLITVSAGPATWRYSPRFGGELSGNGVRFYQINLKAKTSNSAGDVRDGHGG
jgi:hypothetical protein